VKNLSVELKEQLQSALGPAFVLGNQLRGGGMSHVFVADDMALARKVVVKVLNPSLAAAVSVQRFKREIVFTARLQHPNIVPIFSAGEVDGLPFYVMPFVDGDSLRVRLNRDPMIPLGDAIGILRAIASALEYAHANGVVHRDIKPDNVLLSGRTAVVTDFGVAKALSASADSGEALTSLGLALGTPGYMAPEQAMADPGMDHRVDIYSFGLVAYELIAGVTAFGDRSALALVAANLGEAPLPIGTVAPNLPAGLAELVMRCVEKAPEDRPQTAGDVLRLLDEAALLPTGTPALKRGGRPIEVADPAISIAVLPFKNLSGDAENEYLSDGMTEEILNALARVPSLRVAARTSSFAFKGKEIPVQEIARKLRVTNILEGSLRQAGQRIRVSAQLCKATDGFQIWSDRFDRELRDVFEVEDEISAAIVSALKIALFNTRGDAIAAPIRRAPADIEAYELYLKGRFFLNQRVDGMWKAIEFYQRALDKDPSLALAHAGFAEGSFLLTLYGSLSPHEGAPRARDAALRALALDPRLADANVVLGNVSLWYDRDRAESERQLDRAISLQPSNSLAHSCRAYHLASLGRHDEAVAAGLVATELDPLGLFAQSNLAVSYYLARRFADAITCCRTILELLPSNSEAFRWMALSQFQQGEWAAAFAAIESAVELSKRHHWPLANHGAMLARAKRHDEARAILAELEGRVGRGPVPPLAIAVIYYALADIDAFFVWLDRSIQARDVWLAMMHVDPGFDGLRKHPRWPEVAARIGVPDSRTPA
jgi:serine/threonine-protein kinase